MPLGISPKTRQTAPAGDRPTRRALGKRLGFNAAALADLVAPMGLATDAAIAGHLGLDAGYYSRVKNGDRRPGDKFVAHVMGAHYGEDMRPNFDQIFPIVDNIAADDGASG